MIVLTGGAGFIGSCILSELNKRGYTDIIVVDELEKSRDFPNLANKKFSSFFDKDTFLELIRKDKLESNIDVIFHIGACSSTTLDDKDYFMKNNFEYSKSMAEYAVDKNIRFIYASSGATYGDGLSGFSDLDQATLKLKPLNLYGLSKHLFDLWVLNKGLAKRIIGLKYFNVFGPNEYHKADMMSLICKSFDKVVKEKKMRLFKSYKEEYKDGQQKRDFIYVKDAVRATLFFWDNPNIGGIFNIGTGTARTWNDLAQALFKALNIDASIEYIEMPQDLRDKYQYFTQAETGKLKRSGFDCRFMSLEQAVKDYVGYLKNKSYL
ncbi:MAG: ADP-glyceromanno-heptose 6-epimerase [Candidatus Omnitrophica bacterium]|nr:ADP-glyceromanno-heptose 6-epimerase [Candidatus Omnitrophota bacterium]